MSKKGKELLRLTTGFMLSQSVESIEKMVKEKGLLNRKKVIKRRNKRTGDIVFYERIG